DALGGVMARAADAAGIQWRTLNASKGPAVRATRCQADRQLYRAAIRRLVEAEANLDVFQQAVDDLLLESDRVVGVRTQSGIAFHARAVVLTAGTFLAGKIHVGETNHASGRAGEPPAQTLAARLRELALPAGRLKTGTPPRIDGRTIDYTQLGEQPGDDPMPVFSFMGSVAEHPRQVPCHITHTRDRTHAIIRAALDRSPLYTGAIEGVGPRYCPSIEDKVVRFADKTSHQIFVEPEGLDTTEVYPNGISTSLPFDVQVELVRSIVGFENARITRPGYAIEYEYFDPRALKASLEAQAIRGLYFAGQINGTTGYEEAAAQGLIAGLNAARATLGEAPWTPRRDEAYIGVLIDDLTSNGTIEPYRMFTSRAEYRLHLREDNADLRLTAHARALGLVDDTRWSAFARKRDDVAAEQARLGALWVAPGNALAAEVASSLDIAISREGSALDLLRRPDVGYAELMRAPTIGPGVIDTKVAEQVSIQARYSGYLDRQAEDIARQSRQQESVIPEAFDYTNVRGLSAEVRAKLLKVRPETIAQAQRISGVTPAAISLLLVHLHRRSASASA
ncbi:MAG: tRNA uridine-5-carboxymethylaminomethyl(34) synthesis enzyme MnmG, partial [Lysobacterales bacterium]